MPRPYSTKQRYLLPHDRTSRSARLLRTLLVLLLAASSELGSGVGSQPHIQPIPFLLPLLLAFFVLEMRSVRGPLKTFQV